MRAIRIVGAALAFALLAGCQSDQEEAREEVRSRHASWTRLAIEDYSFVYEKGCFCDPSTLKPWRITVRDGQVASVIGVDGSAPHTSYLPAFPTIDQIFVQLEAFLENDGAELSTRFDSRFHFPADAKGDIDNALDAGFTITVTDFRRL